MEDANYKSSALYKVAVACSVLVLLSIPLYILKFVPNDIDLMRFSTLIIISNILFIIGYVVGIILMISEGNETKRSTNLMKFSFPVLLFIAGVLFKIMYWPFAMHLMISGMAGFTFLYLLQFLKKSSRNYIDLLKVIWIISFVMCRLFLLLHWPFRNILDLIEPLMFCVLMICFTKEFGKYRPASKEYDTFYQA
jgi:hypothetical protein